MRFLALACALSVAAAENPSTLTYGLANPRGIYASQSAVWVAQAGNGAVYNPPASECGNGAEGYGCLGATGRVSAYFYDSFMPSLPVHEGFPSFAAANTSGNAVGVHDVHVDSDGLFVIIGAIAVRGNTVEGGVLDGNASCKLYWIGEDDEMVTVADFYAYEWMHNVDGHALDCDPYRFERAANGDFIVADAAANAIYRVTLNPAKEGTISVIAVWENLSVMTQAVPTGVALGKDGSIFVGNLGGFPFTTGSASVRKYAEDGTFEVFADNFTQIVDVAVDARGDVWVLEMAPSLLLLGPTGPPPFGTLTRVDKNGKKTQFLNNGELMLANGLAISPSGDFYIGSNTLGGNAFVTCPQMCENSGWLVKWTPPTPEPEPSAPNSGTVINFNFAGLFNGLNNEPARK